MTAPRYQDVQSKNIPVLFDDNGTTVKNIIGSFLGKTGAVNGIAADPQYLDIFMPAKVKKTIKIDN